MQRLCKEENCMRPSRARGLCMKHYESWRNGYGNKIKLDKMDDYPEIKPGEKCGFEKCIQAAIVRGMCRKHYNRIRYQQYKAKYYKSKPAKT